MASDEAPGSERPDTEVVRLVVFLPLALLPERWRTRAVDMAMVPLLPREAADILEGEPARPELGPEDERLLDLVARRLPVKAIAEENKISVRGVQHRLARLRRRFDVPSTADLAVLAVSRGFGSGANVKRNAKGRRDEDGE